MNTRYLAAVFGVFGLLLLTLLASIFGWGLQAATLATTMVENPRQDTGRSSGIRFHIWHPSFTHHKPKAPPKPPAP